MEQPRSDRSKPRVPSRARRLGRGFHGQFLPAGVQVTAGRPHLPSPRTPSGPGSHPPLQPPGGKYRSAGSVLVTPFPGSHGNRRPGLGFCQHLETQIRRISRSWQRSVSTARFIAPGVSGTRTQWGQHADQESAVSDPHPAASSALPWSPEETITQHPPPQAAAQARPLTQPCSAGPAPPAVTTAVSKGGGCGLLERGAWCVGPLSQRSAGGTHTCTHVHCALFPPTHPQRRPKDPAPERGGGCTHEHSGLNLPPTPSHPMRSHILCSAGLQGWTSALTASSGDSQVDI